MTELNDAGLAASVSLAQRLAEINDLSEDIRLTLQKMAAEMKDPDGTVPPKLVDKLNLIHAIHFKVIAAEDAFHAKTGRADKDATDFDAIRIELGRQLDRIRFRVLAGEISGAADV